MSYCSDYNFKVEEYQDSDVRPEEKLGKSMTDQRNSKQPHKDSSDINVEQTKVKLNGNTICYKPESKLCADCGKRNDKKHNCFKISGASDKYICTNVDCLAIFVKPSQLVDHEYWHRQDTKLNCIVTCCGNMFDLKSDLMKHTVIYHGNAWEDAWANSWESDKYNAIESSDITLRCKVCDKAFEDIKSVNQHEHKLYGVQCKICPKMLPDGNALRSHMVAHKKGEFICHVCSARFKEETNLKTHFEITHESIKLVNKQLSEKEMNKKKGSSVKQSHKRQVRQGILECDLCGTKFGLTRNLYRHMNSLHGVKILLTKASKSYPFRKEIVSSLSK